MIAISIEEMQRNLQSYMSQVEAGETLVITRAGQPVAEIKPVSLPPSADSGPTRVPKKKQLRPYGLAKGEFVESPDFDDPLPEEILRLFEGEAARDATACASRSVRPAAGLSGHPARADAGNRGY